MTLDFEIAGLRLRIETDSAGLADRISQRFASYEALRSSSALDVVLEFWEMDAGWECQREYRPPYPEADMTYAAGRYEFWRHEFEGSLTLGTPVRGAFSVAPKAVSFETPVRLAVALAGSTRDTILLHASGALFDGKALVFTAQSGGGKTTLLSLLPDQVPLSDEIVALTGRGGDWTALSTPFTGGNNPAGKASGKVAAICFLAKGARNVTTPADRRTALRRIMRNTLAYVADPATAAGILATASGLGDKAPFLDLEFEKSAAISGYLRTLAAGLP